MTRKKRPSKIHAKSQELKSVEADLKAARKHSRELLKKQGKNIREFRHEVSVLKKLGIVAKRVDARKVEPSRYRRSQVRKWFDVIVGTHVPVKAPKDVRNKYSDKGIYKERGGFLVVPSEHKDMKVAIKKGKLEVTRPIGGPGGVLMHQLILPYNATDMIDLANRMEHDPTLAAELEGGTQYMFSLFGHTGGREKNIGFVDKAELVKYIRHQYRHLFETLEGKQAVQSFKLVTYSGRKSHPPDIPANIAGVKQYGPRRGGRSEDAYMQERRRVNHAQKEKKRRASLTGPEREEYLAKARARAALRKRARENGNG